MPICIPIGSANYFFIGLFVLLKYLNIFIKQLAKIYPLKDEYLGTIEGPYRTELGLKQIKELWFDKGYKEIKSYALLKVALSSNLCKFKNITK